MNNKSLARTIRLTADECGFSFTKRAFQDEFLRYSGDVAPALWPDIKRVRGLGHRFLCIFGIDVMKFEQEWTEYLARSGFKHQSADSMWPIAVHSLNYNLGMLPPYLNDYARDEELYEMYIWMKLVFSRALEFPQSMEQLVEVLTSGRLLGSDVFRDLGQPAKVRAFFVWLRHNHIVDLVYKLPPLTEDRIWPYENIDVDNWCRSVIS